MTIILLLLFVVTAQEVWNRPDNYTDSNITDFMWNHELTNCYYRVETPYGFLKCRLANQKVYTFQVLLADRRRRPPAATS